MFYTTCISNSSKGFWTKLESRTLRGAKLNASNMFKGEIGDVVKIVECDQDTELWQLNDLPYHVRHIGPDSFWDFIK